MDPYCKILIAESEQSFKTETLDGGGKTPVWDETFTFEVKSLTDDLTVVVQEADPVNDDEVGQIKIKLTELCADASIDDWFTITYEGESAGQVHLKSTWTPSEPLTNTEEVKTREAYCDFLGKLPASREVQLICDDAILKTWTRDENDPAKVTLTYSAPTAED